MAKADETRIDEHIAQGVLTISEIVTQLGEMGIVPFVMRSGLDHNSITTDSMWRPKMGVTANSNEQCHYLFTIAAMAGWTAEYDIEGRGVIVKCTANDTEETLGSWALLLNSARIVLGEIGSTSN